MNNKPIIHIIVWVIVGSIIGYSVTNWYLLRKNNTDISQQTSSIDTMSPLEASATIQSATPSTNESEIAPAHTISLTTQTPYTDTNTNSETTPEYASMSTLELSTIGQQSAEAPSESKKSTTDIAEKTRTITVTNNITKKMLGYSHWTGTYKPTFFNLSINGHTLEPGEALPISIDNNILTISYRYSFMNGYRTGARAITFLVNPEAQNVDITFAWKNTWHVLCDQATPTSVEEIEFKE